MSTGEILPGRGPAFRLIDGNACGEGTSRDALDTRVEANGAVSMTARTVAKKGDANCAVGRRPQGLRSSVAAGTELGQLFALMAHLEAASVLAFAQIERELQRA